MTSTHRRSDRLTAFDLRVLELLANRIPEAIAVQVAARNESVGLSWRDRLAEATTQGREEPWLALVGCLVIALFALCTSLG